MTHTFHIIGLLGAVLLINSCAAMIIPEEDVAEEADGRLDSIVETKGQTPDFGQSEAEISNVLQTSSILTMIHHVICRDGVYMESLTDKDMDTLGVSKEAKDFVFKYVKQLNEVGNEKK